MPGSNVNGLSETYGVQSRTSGSDPSSPPSFNNSGFNFSGVLGTILGNGIGWLRDAWAFKKNRELEEQRHQWSIDDWQRQNDYNSPAAMMARLAQAGINPNLVTGEPTAASISPTSASPGASSSGHGDVSALLPGIQARANIELTKSQIRLQDAQAKDLEASARQRDADIDLKGWQSFFVQKQTNTEYQRGLSLALDNFSKGFVPTRYKASDGSYYYDDQSYGYEFYSQLDDAHNIIRDVAQEYDIRSYDLKYLNRMFNAMVEHDKGLFEHECNLFRSTSAVTKFKADNEWFQFLDYFVDKLSSSAGSVARAYSLINHHR